MKPDGPLPPPPPPSPPPRPPTTPKPQVIVDGITNREAIYMLVFAVVGGLVALMLVLLGIV